MRTAIFPSHSEVDYDRHDDDWPFTIILREGSSTVAAHYCAKRLVELRNQIDAALQKGAAPKERPVDDGEESAVAHQHAGF
jgi:hypothetical protein